MIDIKTNMMKLINDSSRNNEIILEAKGISKFFPGVKALQNVNVTFRRGEVHVLIGENGAGKSVAYTAN